MKVTDILQQYHDGLIDEDYCKLLIGEALITQSKINKSFRDDVSFDELYRMAFWGRLYPVIRFLKFWK